MLYFLLCGMYLKNYIKPTVQFLQSISQLLTILVISCRINFILSKIEADTEVLEALVNSYTTVDRERCNTIF